MGKQLIFVATDEANPLVPNICRYINVVFLYGYDHLPYLKVRRRPSLKLKLKGLSL